MQLTILGAGSSAGTPAIGCQCDTCTSDDPRNKRTRCSSIITLDTGENILIDTGPDLRLQALREGITNIGAVLYTHTHADHLHGIDDLRGFCQVNRKQIPLYSYKEAAEHIKAKFGYTLRKPCDFWDLPVLSINEVNAPFDLFGTTVTPIPIMHGRIQIFGYRIGNIAYMTDVSAIPEYSFALLENLDLLLIDCLRVKEHPTHINIEQSLAYIGQIKAKQSVLIHMTHELEYKALAKMLPKNVSVGYDGLKINI
ncbi:MAG: MBL fold metallo-hydrolase [Methylophilaceae bacterium]|jgi:phosphoribosyl 1,2-cyclic phosphate phosphodiesterase|nr:MBL fold metallo-hydrolase [Methylophilaceae bacterium]MDG1453906.1 MBL fold metallo-hydrolase [Methylophilaceae bacterium]